MIGFQVRAPGCCPESRDVGVDERDIQDLLHHVPRSVTRLYSAPELRHLRETVKTSVVLGVAMVGRARFELATNWLKAGTRNCINFNFNNLRNVRCTECQHKAVLSTTGWAQKWGHDSSRTGLVSSAAPQSGYLDIASSRALSVVRGGMNSHSTTHRHDATKDP